MRNFRNPFFIFLLFVGILDSRDFVWTGGIPYEGTHKWKVSGNWNNLDGTEAVGFPTTFDRAIFNQQKFACGLSSATSVGEVIFNFDSHTSRMGISGTPRFTCSQYRINSSPLSGEKTVFNYSVWVTGRLSGEKRNQYPRLIQITGDGNAIVNMDFKNGIWGDTKPLDILSLTNKIVIPRDTEAKSFDFSILKLDSGSKFYFSEKILTRATKLELINDSALIFDLPYRLSSQIEISVLGNGSVLSVPDEGKEATIEGKITGSYPITKQGKGTLVLASNQNSFTKGLILQQGVVKINSDGALGASSSPIIFDGGTLQPTAALSISHDIEARSNGSTLRVDQGTTTLSGNISGSGNWSKTGAGALLLSGNNSFNGELNIAEGIVYARASSLSRGTVHIQTSLIFDDSASGSWEGRMYGDGSLIKQGSGTLRLAGNNSYGGGTIIKEGTLSVEDISALGPENQGNYPVTFRGGMLEFLAPVSSNNYDRQFILQSSTSTIKNSSRCLLAGTFSGNGTLVKRGEGTLSLLGNNVYSGGTVIKEGVIEIRSNKNLGATESSVTLDGGTLRFASSFTMPRNIVMGSGGGILDVGGYSTQPMVIRGNLSGPGSLRKKGYGILVVNGDAYYGGRTTIQSGTFKIAGTMSNAKIRVESEGIVENSQTINSVASLQNYGKVKGTGTFNFAPGKMLQNKENSHLQAGSSPIGKMTVNGTVVMEPGSSIDVETNFHTANFLHVAGLLDVKQGSYLELILDKPPTTTDWLQFLMDRKFSFSFLEEASLGGNVSAPASPYPGFQVSMNQLANQFSLDVVPIPLASLVSQANQRKIAEIFDHDYILQSQDFIFANSELYFLQLPQLEEALDQLHPALFNNIALAQEETTSYISKVLSQRLEEITWKNPDKKDRSWEVWGQGLRDYARQKGKHTLPGYTATTPGIIAGADVKIDHQFALGLHGAYTNTHIDWESKRAYGHTTTGYGGLYGSWYNENFLVGLSILGGWNSSKASRSILFGEINRMAHHKAHGWEVSPQIELGGLWEWDFLSFEPFLKENYVYLHQNSYKEEGAESLDLQVHSKNADMLRSEIGLGLFHCFQGNQLQLIPEIKLSYIYESRFQGKNTKAYFLNGCEESFSVKGLSPSRSLGHLSALLKGSSYHGIDLTIDYNFLFGKEYRDHKMALRLDYAF